MKRIIFSVVISFLLLSCTNTPVNYSNSFNNRNEYSITIDTDVSKELFNVDFVDFYKEPGISKGKGIIVRFNNNTETPAFIKWSSSSFNTNGLSSPIFLSGNKYIDAGKSMPDTVIPPRENTSTIIFPSNNIVFYNRWIVKPLENGKITIFLTVKLGSEEKYYTIKIDKLNKETIKNENN